MTCIFLTAIGGDIAQNIAKIIRLEYSDWKIVGSDVHERHGGKLYVDKFVVSPHAADPGYGTWIENQIKIEAVAILIPLSEAEIEYFVINEDVVSSDVRVIGASNAIVRVGLDKLETASFLQSIKLPTPWSIPAENVDAIPSYPCIIKPRKSQGSKDIFICKNKQEAQFFSEYSSECIFQDLLLPSYEEITCALYRFQNGKLAVLQLRRKLTGGTTGWAEVIDDDEIRIQCEAIAGNLDFYGSVNVQLINTSDGPRIFEINPRFSSTVLMRHQLGFKDVIWSLQDENSFEVSPYVPPVGTTIVKTQNVSILR